MMQSFAAFLDEFSDDGIGCRSFQQLDARFAHREHRGVDLFGGDGFPQGDFQAELVAIKLERLIDGADGDPEMINS